MALMASPARALYQQPRQSTALVLSRRSLLRPDPIYPHSPFSKFLDRYQAELDEMPEELLRQIEIHDNVVATACSVAVTCKAYRNQVASEVLANA